MIQASRQLRLSAPPKSVLAHETFGGDGHIKERLPFCEVVTELLQPPELRLEFFVTVSVVGSLLQAIEYTQRPLSPAHQDFQIHVAGFGALIRWGEKGERGLLNLRFVVRGLLRELLPGLVVLQCVLEQCRALMFDVIDRAGLPMLVTKPLDAGFQVRALIAKDLSRQAGLVNGFLQLLKHDLTVGAFHRKQGDRFDILMAEHQIGARQVTQAHTQNEQALLYADLNGMVQDPDPVAGFRFRSCQLVVADP